MYICSPFLISFKNSSHNSNGDILSLVLMLLVQVLLQLLFLATRIIESFVPLKSLLVLSTVFLVFQNYSQFLSFLGIYSILLVYVVLPKATGSFDSLKSVFKPQL